MKKIYISFSFLMLCLIGLTSTVNAQARRSSFRVDAPAAISGYKIIEEADMQGTSPWGSSIDSAWENMPVAYDALNPNGCIAFTAGSLTGKFALIYRGGCEFGAKALAAQTAGAAGVIIVNNLLGVAGMGAGASGASVTIPVVMVTSEAGDAMKNQIVGGTPVFISLTGWRFDSVANPIDIGFMNDGPVHPLAKCIPAHQMSTSTGNSDERWRLFSGSLFYNFSVVDWDTLFQFGRMSYRPSLTSGTFAPEDSNSIKWSFSTPATTTDSLLQIIIDTLGTTVMGFDMNDKPVGTYKMENELFVIPSNLTVPSEETPTSQLNNFWDYEFAVCDSIYSKCNYDFNKKSPMVNSYINFAASTPPNEWGPVLEIRNPKYKAQQMQVVIMRGVIDDSIFANQEVAVSLYKWDDADANGAIDQTSEITEIANGSYMLLATDIVPIAGKTLTIDLTNTASPGADILLEQDAKYWMTVKVPGGDGNFALGSDYYSDYSANLNFGLGQGNPLLNAGMMFGGGFANGGSPSMALIMSKDPVAIHDVASFNGSVNVYPNPTSDNINVSVKMDKLASSVSYEIVDVTGKTIATSSKKNVLTDIYTYNTNKLSAGTYFVNITTESGKTQVKFVVAK